MEQVYVYGGYILTGGTLENGNPWKGFNVMLAEVKSTPNGYSLPMVSFVAKATRNDTADSKSLHKLLQELSPGRLVKAYFSAPDAKGRSKLVFLQPLDK